MKKILALNNISKKASVLLTGDYELVTDCPNPDGIIVRSFSMHEYDLPDSVVAVARAGAGTNNIPSAEYAKKGVVVFNTPGANANAVKELALAALFISGRKIIRGAEWAQTLKGQPDYSKQVESGKKQFIGGEILGKTLGVIGLGAIGALVANSARALGMNVIGFDPYITTENALHLDTNVKLAKTLDELLKDADFVTIHVPYLESTKNTINAGNIYKMKKGAALINLARGELVETSAVVEAVKSGHISRYVTDFGNDDLLGIDNIVVFPHLGASTPEAEDNCAIMAVDELKDFLENGNIKNSVNFPACSAPRCGEGRIAIVHKNESSVISAISDVIGKKGYNIENFVSKSKGELAYALIDTTKKLPGEIVSEINDLSTVIRTRVIY